MAVGEGLERIEEEEDVDQQGKQVEDESELFQ